MVSQPFGSATNFQYPRCWIVSSDTNHADPRRGVSTFQYPRCWIVSSDSALRSSASCLSGLSVSSLLDRFLRRTACAAHGASCKLSVSSLLDRFLRLPTVPLALTPRSFQYPRCWIVSSDLSDPLRYRANAGLSVSSLLDRFLRPFRHESGGCVLFDFQYPRCWIVSSDRMTTSICNRSRPLSVSSLLDRFLRHLR